ncbi:VWA domain-containing protein [Kribbella sp. NBC_00709]|uniref:vWA domain-containing protein n=1 Tax=Kribbella sp. NBC_00709 TaxID=2975972 RepID=UPI002E2AAEBE|nr:VWA domain-containing protein [Kribbella sp. NBC_00709]
MAEPAEPALALAGFASALRHAGLPVTADRVQLFLRAVAALDPTVTSDVYWAGRAALCGGPDDTARYDEVFAAWFSGQRSRGVVRRTPQTSVQAALDEGGEGADGERTLNVSASTTEVLRHRDVADLSATDRAELARLFGTLRPRVPVRRANRRRPSHRGEIDPRRTLRAQLRQVGEPGRVRYRRRGVRPRRIVVLIDVSGSMRPYADSLLRLAHTMVQKAPRAVEVFTIGTRLTRVTPALRHRDADFALRSAGDVVPDWSGGTRLGEVLKVFLDRWGQRGTARRAVVVVCSDGWERGDSSLLGAQMQRLAGLAHRVVWLNPHRGKPGYEPVQAGIVAVLPHVDDLVAGHSLTSFAALLEVVADA